MNEFVGQNKIVRELAAIEDALKRDKNLSINLLLRGPGGCGKTMLAQSFASKFGRFSFQIPRNHFIWKKRMDEYRCHIVDEIHLLKTPEEVYPYLDKKQFVFIFATTEVGVLAEPLTSRCINLVFQEYSLEDIVSIIIQHSKDIDFEVTEDTAKLIAERCKLSPRIAKQYLERMHFIIEKKYHPLTLNGIINAFKDIGVFEGGYTDADIMYLKLLSKLGKASLQTISGALRMDKATITNDIEPFLIMNGHISIGSKGRQFLGWRKMNDNS